MSRTTNLGFPILDLGDPLNYNPTIEVMDDLIFRMMKRIEQLELRISQIEGPVEPIHLRRRRIETNE